MLPGLSSLLLCQGWPAGGVVVWWGSGGGLGGVDGVVALAGPSWAVFCGVVLVFACMVSVSWLCVPFLWESGCCHGSERPGQAGWLTGWWTSWGGSGWDGGLSCEDWGSGSVRKRLDMDCPFIPYPDPEPGPQQRFNVAHCRTRAQVEMTIGILKSRFQCLQKLRVTPERACDIIVACVVLHNIAIIRGEQHPAVQINDPADDHPIPADVQDGRAARDLIARNYF
ncbi:putative nuclease HARBI1 [Merluccius polli]|uniref:Nuclease HARBI1 n=2 Tax=Merluccius polli TaxID=89951 RepID=A0AA47MP89_MERPO|nr:putative nuclease HARBI1 [Merluccius polli]